MYKRQGAGEIFSTDFNGDGTVGDPIPGTKQGAFMRSVSLGDLPNVVNNYNNAVANNPTPAGNVLINNGLFTLAQLQALGGVAPALSPVVPGEVGLTWLKTFDMSLTWVGKVNKMCIRDRMESHRPSEQKSGPFRPVLSDAIRYWEPRRFTYNFALLAVCVGWFVVAWPHFRPALTWSSLPPCLLYTSRCV